MCRTHIWLTWQPHAQGQVQDVQIAWDEQLFYSAAWYLRQVQDTWDGSWLA